MITVAQAASNLDVPDQLTAFMPISSSTVSPLAGLSITWPKKLPSMHSRILLHCLQLAVLLSQ